MYTSINIYRYLLMSGRNEGCYMDGRITGCGLFWRTDCHLDFGTKLSIITLSGY